MKRVAILLLSGLLGACAETRWVRSDVGAAQAQRETIACQREAEQEAGLRSAGFYGSLSQYYGPNYQPYGRTRWLGAPGPMFDFDPVGSRMMEEGRLADACMRAKGYQPAPRN